MDVEDCSYIFIASWKQGLPVSLLYLLSRKKNTVFYLFKAIATAKNLMNWYIHKMKRMKTERLQKETLVKTAAFFFFFLP